MGVGGIGGTKGRRKRSWCVCVLMGNTWSELLRKERERMAGLEGKGNGLKNYQRESERERKREREGEGGE